jgi:hydroxylamine reductase
LPLSLVISWYEQKAVAILLTLLYLGVRNIRIGPSLPAFLHPSIAEALSSGYGLSPIGRPEEDLRRMLENGA